MLFDRFVLLAGASPLLAILFDTTYLTAASHFDPALLSLHVDASPLLVALFLQRLPQVYLFVFVFNLHFFLGFES